LAAVSTRPHPPVIPPGDLVTSEQLDALEDAFEKSAGEAGWTVGAVACSVNEGEVACYGRTSGSIVVAGTGDWDEVRTPIWTFSEFVDSETVNSTTTTTAPGTTTTTTLSPPPSIVLEGNGDQVIPIGQTLSQIYVVLASNDGTSNFTVESLTEGLEDVELVVNEIGPITSRNLMNTRQGDTATYFEVSAEGNWRLELIEVAVAIQTGVIVTWDGVAPLTGSGNDVFAYSGSPGILQYSNSGDSNFVVEAYSDDDSDLLVNDIGPVDGSSRITAGPLVVTVSANDAWSLAVQLV